MAENASDGIVAPLFYAAVGGAPLALAYRAVNTLDAMYGHRTRANLYFGRAAARLDDFLNYLPARLTALLFLAAGCFLGKCPFTAWRVLSRDGHKHPSPNSGRPEAAMAGLLGIRLGGKSSYHGEVSSRPYLNASGRPAAEKDIAEALKIMQVSSVLALALCILVSLMVSMAARALL
ncbi:MAG: cobalamin biosynthesis protein [Bacillota bacterium]